MRIFGTATIYLAGSIAAIGALLHLAAIAGGPAWYVFFNAPPQVVTSAHAGTWLAPVSTSIIAILMGLCAAYAFSAVGRFRRLPLPRLMLGGMTGVCLLRALVIIPLAINHPQLRNTFEIVSAVVWGVAGIGFALAYSSLLGLGKRPAMAASPSR